MCAVRHLPDPPQYLDPLSDLDGSHYYAVPKFFSHDHPNTRWLMCMLAHNRIEGVLRKMEMTPALFSNAYYQLADDPRLYLGPHSNQPPVFHKQAVLYLTTLAAAIYVCKDEHCIDSLLNYRDTYKAPMYSPNSVEYATHVQSPQTGDLHAFPVYVVMLRCCKFNCALALLRHGWVATQPLAMPLRRLRERRILRVADWLDYALLLLSERPTYPLAALAAGMARDPSLWPRGQLPMSQLLDGNILGEEAGQPRQLMLDADDLLLAPENRQQQPSILGARTLAELVKDYGKYQQAKQLRADMHSQIRRARALGIEPEHLLAQSLDYSAAFRRPVPLPIESPEALADAGQNALAASTGSNNNARKSSSLVSTDQGHYASEPVRILHHALERDKHGKSGRQCCEAANVYIKRGYYMTELPLPLDSAQLRDVRNTVVLILNLAERELELMAQCKSPSRRGAYQKNATQFLQMSTRVLLHSREFASFAQNEAVPTYQIAVEIDFPFTTGLMQRLADIRLGVAREFNVDPVESSRYLTVDQVHALLYAAAKTQSPTAAALLLKLRLGQPPRVAGEEATADEAQLVQSELSSSVKEAKQGRNINCCSPDTHGSWTQPFRSPQITFVRVANRKTLRRKQAKTPKSTSEADDKELIKEAQQEAQQEAQEVAQPIGALLIAKRTADLPDLLPAAGDSDKDAIPSTNQPAATTTTTTPRPRRFRWLTRIGQRVWHYLRRPRQAQQ